MKHLQTDGPSQREQQVVGLRNGKVWLHHKEMGKVVGGEIREGTRVRQGPAHRRPLRMWASL